MAVEVQKPRIEAYWTFVEEECGAVIVTNKLDNAPEAFFILDNPDSYALKALANPGRFVSVGTFERTSLRQMVNNYHTNSFQFNSSYYNVDFLYADPAPPPYSFTEFHPFLFAGWVLLGVSILIAVAIRRAKIRNMVNPTK